MTNLFLRISSKPSKIKKFEVQVLGIFDPRLNICTLNEHCSSQSTSTSLNQDKVQAKPRSELKAI